MQFVSAVQLLHVNDVRPKLNAVNKLEVVDQAAEDPSIRLLKIVKIHFDIDGVAFGAQEKCLPEFYISHVVGRLHAVAAGSSGFDLLIHGDDLLFGILLLLFLNLCLFFLENVGI